MSFFRQTSFALVAGLIAISPAHADTIRADFNGSTLASNDDGSTGPVAIGFDANFFGATFQNLFVNNNGNVTFDGSLGAFTPFDLQSTTSAIIAPFFADVDTRNSANVTYGQGSVGGNAAFGVNWIDVGFFPSQNDPLNSFQLVLIDRSDTGAGNFDIEFNYGSILWETGSASGGQGGFGGNSARAGFSNGVDTSFEIAGSAINGAFLDSGSNSLSAGSNIGEAGRFLFSARNGAVVNPSPVPLPAGGLLLLSGLGAITVMRRKRKKS